ncbi:MAG: o-succinylbenzoate synthase [Bryobacteraceae bacterium]|nr:o-succinylbenzoate synthase [Bryobacteraceae bacterium]
MGFKVDQVRLHQISMPLVHFFETSFGRTYSRDMILVEVVSNGVSGWGEVTCGEHPFYNEEWTESAWLLLKNYIAPKAAGKTLEAQTAGQLSAGIRGHKMAQGGFEVACWDLQARLNGVPLWREIGGETRFEIPCGVSIGIQDSVDQLIEKIRLEVDAGYRRIKMKIKPGWDIDVVARVRAEFSSILLMADANSAYTLADVDRLKALDEFNLMMIEQPLAHDEIIDHATLQAALSTPICLDECIRNSHQAAQAIRLGACRIINIKLGRVGGFAEALRVHDVCFQAGIPVWCGGMLESGVGRAHNVALSTLPGFTLPGDVSASKRYWKRDVIDPWVEVSSEGTITVPGGPGFGYHLDLDFLASVRARLETLSPQ